MKNTLTLLSVLLLSAANTFGQKGITLSAGLQPSMSMGGDYQMPESVIDPDFTNLSKDNTMVFKFGLDAGYNFTDKLGISAGLYFTDQGQKYKDREYTIAPGNTITFQRDVSLTYLQVPIQFHYISDYNKKITWFLSAGVYMGFLTEYTDERTYDYSLDRNISAVATDDLFTVNDDGVIDESTITSNLIDQPYKNFDWGGIAAAGLQFRLCQSLSIPVGISYQYGFVNVKNNESRYTTGKSTYEYEYWQYPMNSDNPNKSVDYHNSLLGFQIGLKYSFQSKAAVK